MHCSLPVKNVLTVTVCEDSLLKFYVWVIKASV